LFKPFFSQNEQREIRSVFYRKMECVSNAVLFVQSRGGLLALPLGNNTLSCPVPVPFILPPPNPFGLSPPQRPPSSLPLRLLPLSLLRFPPIQLLPRKPTMDFKWISREPHRFVRFTFILPQSRLKKFIITLTVTFIIFVVTNRNIFISSFTDYSIKRHRKSLLKRPKSKRMRCRFHCMLNSEEIWDKIT